MPFFESDNVRWFYETLSAYSGQMLRVDEVLLEEKTECQSMILFRNSLYGRVFVLDNVIQLTEKDEFIYHEMMAHVPLNSHRAPKNVLIIGGGDGGVLREVLKHSDIRLVVLVEIDKSVIDFSREYLPMVSDGAFDDPRVEVIIADGTHFVKDTKRMFDVVLVDSTDPIGPGAVLFTKEFHQDLQRCMRPDAILVTQNGVLYTQSNQIVETSRIFRSLYAFFSFYLAEVPTYTHGSMALGWATASETHSTPDFDLITERYEKGNWNTQYYNPRIHLASFALPNYGVELLGR